MKEVEHREVQHDKLRVLQLHEGVAIGLVRCLFNPKRRGLPCVRAANTRSRSIR